MRCHPALGALVVAAFPLQIVPAWAQSGYWWCDALNAGYPWVQTCPNPWRYVSPTPQTQPQTSKPVVAPPTSSNRRTYRREPPPSTVAAGACSSTSAAFQQGQADRQSWETWFNSQVGEYRSGAEYWASHRSLTNPGSCNSSPPSTGAEWGAGCTAAQQRLAPSDARRKTEPDYRRGWNNPPAASLTVPPPLPSETQPGSPASGDMRLGQNIRGANLARSRKERSRTAAN
jgi:hypothetical protein